MRPSSCAAMTRSRSCSSASGRELAERFQYLGKGVAARRILVDRSHGLITRRDGSLHHSRCEPASAKGAVCRDVVLLGAKAIAAEQERAVHVQQHDREAGQDGGRTRRQIAAWVLSGIFHWSIGFAMSEVGVSLPRTSSHYGLATCC